MYLSLLEVNTGDDPNQLRPGRSWLANPYQVHQRLCMAFPSAARASAGEPAPCHVRRASDRGFLFRVEPSAPTRLLVQSASLPAWQDAFANAAFLLRGPPRVKECDPAFARGLRLRFRLRANPTVRRKVPDREEGIRVGVVGEDRQRAWLEAQAAKAGFTFEAVDITDEGPITARKPDGGHRMTFRSVRFDGVLVVTDPDHLKAALAAGIGSGKAFGFGLLSLARA
jgi:CRISPR system Cascade subunit CasE